MVVLTTGHTTTSGVLAVLSNTTVTGRDMATVLPRLGKASRHVDGCLWLLVVDVKVLDKKITE